MKAGVCWEPTADWVRSSHIQRFIEAHGLGDLAELQARAAHDPSWFWDAVVKDLGIEWYEPYTQVLDRSRGVEWPTWFLGGRLNLAHNCVDKHVRAHRRDWPAVIYESEEGITRTWTYGQLWQESNRVANALRRLGVARGDRIGIFMPMVPETVAAIMGIAKMGAVFVPIFSGYGSEAVASRLSDCGARLLFTVDGYPRRGKQVNMKILADEAVALVPCVERVIVCRRLGLPIPWNTERDCWWNDLMDAEPEQFTTDPMSSEDPLMIIYTSGTTGRPKGAVHVHGGFPIKTVQDMAHCFDLREQERILWFTDLGWMMGPWVIFGSLMSGATCCLYDGAPDYPGHDRLWAMVAAHQITHLGLSPTVIRALMPYGNDLPNRHDLRSLRVLGSTGEPWNPDPYLWYFRNVGGGRAPIINYSGGTEISGGILGCVPIRPIKVMGFNCAIAGMAADVVDEAGRPIPPGTVGELVIRTPWPGMTRGFWRDPERYVDAYWNRIPGVWVHGDWASVDADGAWYIHGRSDDTIKVAGKRVGPAEFESILIGHPAVVESAAIGVPHELKGETVVCFVVVKSGTEGDAALAQALRERIASSMGKALVPDAITFVPAIPKTRNGKIMRRLIRAAYLGRDLGDTSTLDNPEALTHVQYAR